MKRAVFWTAWGERYVKEASISARSVKRHMPDLPRILYTRRQDKKDAGGYFTRPLMPKVNLRGRIYEGLISLNYRVDAIGQLTEYDQLLFLDSDTHLCAPVYDFFDMLDRFDFVGVMSHGRHTRPTVNPIPDAFVEYNGGVLVFRNTAEVRALWADALRRYDENMKTYKRGNQGAIREAVWLDKQGLQFGTAPQEFCFRFPFGGKIASRVKILHGRPKEHSLEEICRIVNKEPDGVGRTWGPGDLAMPHPKFRRVKVERGGRAGL